jgi:hypothetical protein
MGNIFIPDHFVAETSSPADVKLASIAWGFQLGFTLLTAAKAGGQSIKIWRRVGRITTYTALTWIEIIAKYVYQTCVSPRLTENSFVIGAISWVYLIGKIPPSYVYAPA